MTMQACEGYFENGQFYPIGKVARMPGRHRAVLTIMDELAQSADVDDIQLRSAWLKKLNMAIGLSLDEELPDIQRSTFMREPVDLADKQ